MDKILLALGAHLFHIFGLLAVTGALSMVFSRNAVHSVIAFLFTMACMAGAYFTLAAEFLAVAQLLVYAGGIVVLFLFVVMLVELSKAKEQHLFHRIQTPVAVTGALGAVAAFGWVFRHSLFGGSAEKALSLGSDLVGGTEQLGNAQMVSRGLYAGYLLPFEILSVILLVALIGAVVLAKAERV